MSVADSVRREVARLGLWRTQAREQRWCSHTYWRRLHGDEIRMVRRGRDAQCLDCGQFMTKGLVVAERLRDGEGKP